VLYLFHRKNEEIGSRTQAQPSAHTLPWPIPKKRKEKRKIKEIPVPLISRARHAIPPTPFSSSSLFPFREPR